ncbi:HPr family phosphocarrier protein [Yersinia enterocolitica]|uniref:HPr family phosphocarrier protein n=1 Tax=Yersinia enterocolitica TaxID=630 RepID=UPI00227A88E5|nr:HPr family phosphocarrier protein [Yersinia enterocolitica]EKN3978805.1 HPr family phosphocarrier protein [Yersinia enterocolitica]EKN3983383.1 HPr family phosphocarrier protein [Yersinia enterocolitica]EKN5941547.1 HPr family phosphocarrier protein [Yersinia enterocolitica]EKN6163806.1 HPr family phosphocarrier protein [Yersinia enterocolitica]EKN6222648.1 HPr family phosphocarrier protein [Yersinia enterocolitica]
MPKFAANLSMMFTEVPFLERFKSAKDAGFGGVEFLFPYDYPADQLAAKLKEQGLQQVLFNTSPGDINAGEWGLAALPGREKEARRDIDLALEYALALGCPSIHIMAGVVPVDADRKNYQQTFIDNVRYAADRFAEHNINVMIEALNPKIKPNYLFSSQYQTLELVNLINRPNVFTQLDLFHAQIVDGNLSHLITAFAGRYGHIQIASVPGRHEPDEGEINYAYLFGLLDEINYKGWIGCEYHPRAGTVAGLNWIQPYLS